MSETILNAYQETITWTKEQQACLNYTGNKTLMVKGFAGAGKSLVIQEIAKRLMAGIATGQKHRVAIFSYNNTLNSVTKDILKINGEPEDYITVTTLMSYLTRVYKAIGGPNLKLCTGDYYHKIKQEAVQTAIMEHKKHYSSHRFHDLDSSFWIEEFDWMKDMNVSTQDEEYYLRLQRKGRGNKVRMLTADRKAAFQLFTFYDHAIAKKKVGDWTDYALYIIRHAERIPDELKFDYVLIDEAQDLSLTYMIAAMMFFKKDMIIAMDANQRIYNKQWSPKLLGIEATTKRLTKSMRTTKQIDNLAESIRSKNEGLLSDDDKSLRAIPEREGSLPWLVHLESAEAEKKYVTELVKKYLAKDGRISIGILAAQNKQVYTFSKWMADAGIYHETIDKKSEFSMTRPGVKIVNVYNAKGLEFPVVIIPQFTCSNYPPYEKKTDDEEEMQAFLATCRNQIYVAMTRAKSFLAITYYGEKGSRFIGELDTGCYEVKGLPITFVSGTGTGTRRKTNDIALPESASVSAPEEAESSLIDFFKGKGLEVIDNRPSKGSLWVVGEKKTISPIIKEAEKRFGVWGSYTTKGGKATKNRPAWYTTCRG